VCSDGDSESRSTGADPPDCQPGSRTRAGHNDDQTVCADGRAHGYAANRAVAFSKAPEPGLLGGVVPVAYNRLAMLTGYISPDQHFIACPNQDVAYGAGFFDLDLGPTVIQVPDFGNRFWVFALYDGRTDEFAEIGKQYGTKPGFYLMVGPNWKGDRPAGITAVVRSSTRFAFAVPRIFMDDTPEDRTAIQPVLSQVKAYPLSEFDQKMKITDWSKLPHFPSPQSTGPGETKWVNPDTFFDELPAVMRQVPPLPGEEALYAWIGSVLSAAGNDPQISQTLKETAAEAERDSHRSCSGATMVVLSATVGTRQSTMPSGARTISTAPAPLSRTCMTIGPRKRNTFTPTMTAKVNS
jgi:hypothetical protein